MVELAVRQVGWSSCTSSTRAQECPPALLGGLDAVARLRPADHDTLLALSRPARTATSGKVEH